MLSIENQVDWTRASVTSQNCAGFSIHPFSAAACFEFLIDLLLTLHFMLDAYLGKRNFVITH